MEHREENRDVRFCLLGDVSLNGRWRDPHAEIFQPDVLQSIGEYDAVLLNLESPVKGRAGENLLKNPRLSTSVDAIEKLRPLRPRVCVLGNNHVYDQLEDGFVRTREAVHSLGALTVGAGLTDDEARRPARFKLLDSDVSVLAYVGAETNPNLPKDARVRLNMIDPGRMVADVEREKSAGRYVIVSMHWGEEFYHYPAPWQRQLARRLCVAGTDVVWGHHAHVCQGWERIKDSCVFYCLGNSVFDDVEHAPKWDASGRKSLLVSISKRRENLGSSEFKVRLIRRPTAAAAGQFAENNDQERILCAVFKWPFTAYRCHHVVRLGQALFNRLWNYFFGEDRNPWQQIKRLPNRLWDALISH